MSKKQKKARTRRPNLPLTEVPSSTSTAAGAGTPVRDTSFRPDYTYVRKDLRRIAWLAGTFIVLMIVASFFFR